MTSNADAPDGQGRDYQLPGLLAEIADAAGLSAALAIAQVKGGTKTHFPASCEDDHWLVATVGREAADRVCAHFTTNFSRGVTEVVPLGPTKLYERARFQALALLDAGRSNRDVAREIGVSLRSIEVWKSAERKRKAARRVGRPKASADGTVELSRVYAPVQGGLIRQLSAGGVTPSAETSAPATPAGNAPPLPEVDVGALPQILAEIAHVAGLGACIVLGSMKGARVLHVTEHAGRGDELVRLVGVASAERLTAFYLARHGGTIELLIPKVSTDVFLDVAAWCQAVRDVGHAAQDVADWLGITPEVVEHLCAYMRARDGGPFSFRGAFPHFTPSPET